MLIDGCHQEGRNQKLKPPPYFTLKNVPSR